MGDRSDSNVYISHKLKKAKEVGIDARLIKLNNDITQADLENQIDALNNDYDVDGIIVQVLRAFHTSSSSAF